MSDVPPTVEGEEPLHEYPKELADRDSIMSMLRESSRNSRSVQEDTSKLWRQQARSLNRFSHALEQFTAQSQTPARHNLAHLFGLDRLPGAGLTGDKKSTELLGDIDRNSREQTHTLSDIYSLMHGDSSEQHKRDLQNGIRSYKLQDTLDHILKALNKLGNLGGLGGLGGGGGGLGDWFGNKKAKTPIAEAISEAEKKPGIISRAASSIGRLAGRVAERVPFIGRAAGAIGSVAGTVARAPSALFNMLPEAAQSTLGMVGRGASNAVGIGGRILGGTGRVIGGVGRALGGLAGSIATPLAGLGLYSSLSDLSETRGTPLMGNEQTGGIMGSRFANYLTSAANAAMLGGTAGAAVGGIGAIPGAIIGGIGGLGAAAYADFKPQIDAFSSKIIGTVGKGLGGMWDTISTVSDNIFDKLPMWVVSKIPTWSDIQSTLGSALTGDLFGNVATTIADTLTNASKWIADKFTWENLKGLISSLIFGKSAPPPAPPEPSKPPPFAPPAGTGAPPTPPVTPATTTSTPIPPTTAASQQLYGGAPASTYTNPFTGEPLAAVNIKPPAPVAATTPAAQIAETPTAPITPTPAPPLITPTGATPTPTPAATLITPTSVTTTLPTTQIPAIPAAPTTAAPIPPAQLTTPTGPAAPIVPSQLITPPATPAAPRLITPAGPAQLATPTRTAAPLTAPPRFAITPAPTPATPVTTPAAPLPPAISTGGTYQPGVALQQLTPSEREQYTENLKTMSPEQAYAAIRKPQVTAAPTQIITAPQIQPIAPTPATPPAPTSATPQLIPTPTAVTPPTVPTAVPLAPTPATPAAQVIPTPAQPIIPAPTPATTTGAPITPQLITTPAPATPPIIPTVAPQITPTPATTTAAPISETPAEPLIAPPTAPVPAATLIAPTPVPTAESKVAGASPITPEGLSPTERFLAGRRPSDIGAGKFLAEKFAGGGGKAPITTTAPPPAPTPAASTAAPTNLRAARTEQFLSKGASTNLGFQFTAEGGEVRPFGQTPSVGGGGDNTSGGEPTPSTGSGGQYIPGAGGGGGGGGGGKGGGPYVPSGDAVAQTTNILKGFEGYISAPKWDVNAMRAGYGSDTKTDPKTGQVTKITAGMSVSREEAEADLSRRITTEFMPKAANTIGHEAWDKLTPQAQAAITSVTYNYGHVPSGVAAAAKSGDVQGIGKAISALGSDNSGVNAKRRQQEAQIAMTPSAPPTTPGTAQAAAPGTTPITTAQATPPGTTPPTIPTTPPTTPGTAQPTTPGTTPITTAQATPTPGAPQLTPGATQPPITTTQATTTGMPQPANLGAAPLNIPGQTPGAAQPTIPPTVPTPGTVQPTTPGTTPIITAQAGSGLKQIPSPIPQPSPTVPGQAAPVITKATSINTAQPPPSTTGTGYSPVGGPTAGAATPSTPAGISGGNVGVAVAQNPTAGDGTTTLGGGTNAARRDGSFTTRAELESPAAGFEMADNAPAPQPAAPSPPAPTQTASAGSGGNVDLDQIPMFISDNGMIYVNTHSVA